MMTPTTSAPPAAETAWVSGGRRWGARHVVVLVVCVAALCSAVFDVVDLPDRIELRLAREQDAASMYWSALAMAGVDTDSATQIVLRQLRERLAGTRRSYDDTPFTAAPAIDDVWRAKGLNPFRDARWTNPRTDAELHGLRASQVDARLVIQSAHGYVEAAERWRMQQRVAVCLLIALVGAVWLARQRRPRVMLGAVALT